MDEKKITPFSTTPEEVLEAVAAVGARAPWISDALFPLLKRMAIQQNFGRVRGVLVDMSQQIKDFEPQDALHYLKTDDFYQVCELALRQAADEPDESKRKSYACFLANVLKLPKQSFGEKISLLNDLQQLPPDGVRLLKALLQEPEGRAHIPLYQTLQQRLPDLPIERIAELTQQLESQGIATFKNQTALLRGRTPGDLKGLITRNGQRLLSYILPAG